MDNNGKKLTDEELDELWSKLGDITFDYNEDDDEYYLTEDFHVWEKGTSRTDIWHWFDSKYSEGLGKRHF